MGIYEYINTDTEIDLHGTDLITRIENSINSELTKLYGSVFYSNIFFISTKCV